jgi:HD-like signal output (HDOD) protein
MARRNPIHDTDTVVLGSAYGQGRTATADLVTALERSLDGRKLALPSLPEVALKIRSALADDDVSVNEIVRLLGADPALAARVLRTANSAMFYRGTRPITTMTAAVYQLGQKMIRNVAMSFAAQQVFGAYRNRSIHALVSDVWLHSVRVAVLAHMLARVRTTLDHDEAFLAGLLHEVGRLHILVNIDAAAGLGPKDAAFEAVVAEFHPRLGRAIIEAWELPEELAVAVGEHERGSLAAPEPPTLTAVLAAANYLAEHAEHAEAAGGDADAFERIPDLGSLAVDRSTFDWLIRASDVDVRMLMMAFGL